MSSAKEEAVHRFKAVSREYPAQSAVQGVAFALGLSDVSVIDALAAFEHDPQMIEALSKAGEGAHGVSSNDNAPEEVDREVTMMVIHEVAKRARKSINRPREQLEAYIQKHAKKRRHE